jgi:hypothetical protein
MPRPLSINSGFYPDYLITFVAYLRQFFSFFLAYIKNL